MALLGLASQTSTMLVLLSCGGVLSEKDSFDAVSHLAQRYVCTVAFKIWLSHYKFFNLLKNCSLYNQEKLLFVIN